MKKCLLFFLLGVSVTLLLGAATSVMLGNKHYVSTDDSYGIMHGNKYYVSTDDSYGIMLGNKYYVSTDDPMGVTMGNRYYVEFDGKITKSVKKAMAVGFIHGMAVGRKKAEEERQSGLN